MANGIFTRKRLREIVPGLTIAQENQIIDLYLAAIKRRVPQAISAEQNLCNAKHRAEIAGMVFQISGR